MPEGDSVWRTARRLDRGLAGGTVVRSDLRVPQHATADLRGRTVLGTDTYGKHLFTRFDGSGPAQALTLHTHLRMDGEWTVQRPGRRLPARLAPDVRALLETDSGRVGVALRMPVVELMSTRDEVRVTRVLGPDPLRADWDAGEAVRRLGADPDRRLAAALLDQRVLAGLGNLWVNELCFVRGHSPWARTGDVDLTGLVATAARMLRQSVAVRGNGQVTTGDPRPGHEHWVYQRSGQPCRRCRTPVRYAAAVPGDARRRATWWCPHCQPGPNPATNRDDAAGRRPRTRTQPSPISPGSRPE